MGSIGGCFPHATETMAVSQLGVATGIQTGLEAVKTSVLFEEEGNKTQICN